MILLNLGLRGPLMLKIAKKDLLHLTASTTFVSPSCGPCCQSAVSWLPMCARTFSSVCRSASRHFLSDTRCCSARIACTRTQNFSRLHSPSQSVTAAFHFRRTFQLFPIHGKVRHILGIHSSCGRLGSCRVWGATHFRLATMSTSSEKPRVEKDAPAALSSADEEMRKTLRKIFLTSVEAVMPKAMMEKKVQFNPATSTLMVDGRSYAVSRNVFVVGFGKAVLGMARIIDDLLGPHIIKGIISIPVGARADYQRAGKTEMLLLEGSKICVQEGAANNLPDVASYRAARDIYKLISNLTSKDIVIVLMSGGGSTLLPYPAEPLDINDLLQTTSELFAHGASIAEVNTVRTHLEQLKGGGLARVAMPAQVVSLIISDVIGDSLELIASGPTVRQTYSPHRCLEVIHRLNARAAMPQKVLDMLETNRVKLASQSQVTAGPIGSIGEQVVHDNTDWSRVHNVLVGSNAVVCAAAASCAEQLGFVSLILSHELSGEARRVGEVMGKLAQYVAACYHPRVATTADSDLIMLELDIASYGISKNKLNEIGTHARRAYNSRKPMCLVAGGETVVTLKGKGKGGRNQELVLAAGIQLQQGFNVLTERNPSARVFLLSGGTDGQDGPNDATGALVDENFMVDARSQGLNPQDFLEANDSYGLWAKFSGSRDHLLTGLTGTNVMDLQLLVVRI